MARIVSAVPIYNAQNNQYVGDQNVAPIMINCERLDAYTPRSAWLLRWQAPGDGTLVLSQLTFELSSADVAAYGSNILQGVYISVDGNGVLVDVASPTTILTACNGCCDDDVAVPLTRYYTTGIPAFTAPSFSSYCIARVDDGSSNAFNDFACDYNPLQGLNIVSMRSHASGISYYDVTSAVPIIPIGTDAVTAGACVRQ